MNASRIVGGFAAFALLAGVAGVAGCGSSGPAVGGAARLLTSGLSRSELARRANAICAIVRDESRAVPMSASIGTDAAVTATYFAHVSLIADRALKAMRALTPAADAASAWHAFVAAEVAIDELVRTLEKKAVASDPSGIAPLYVKPPEYQTFSDAASKLGAAGCR